MRTARSIQAIGRTAHEALVASGGNVEADAFGATGYARAKDEVIFFANSSTAMHPRIVVLRRPGRVGEADRFDVAHLAAWEPPRKARKIVDDGALRAASDTLRHHLATLSPPHGLAPLLLGQVAAFPLDRARGLVDALATAIDADDARAIQQAALPLLGLGPGLTPSGDDLVGAALFARRTLMPFALAANPSLSANLVAMSRRTSHPIAAALFADLVSGDSFAPLHDLAIACAERDTARIRSSANALVRIGSASGFDMLAGFIIGIAGRAVLSPLGPNL